MRKREDLLPDLVGEFNQLLLCVPIVLVCHSLARRLVTLSFACVSSRVIRAPASVRMQREVVDGHFKYRSRGRKSAEYSCSLRNKSTDSRPWLR
jgi:hypothetical protein